MDGVKGFRRQIQAFSSITAAALLAQLGERRSAEREVRGSSTPAGPTLRVSKITEEKRLPLQ